MVDEEDNITVAEARAAFAHDMGTAAARLQELLGNRPDQAIASLPKVKRDEVRAIQRMIGEWLGGLKEARNPHGR
jgi:hypothetical protein